MNLRDLSAGVLAGVACLTLTINDDPPKPVQSIAWSVSRDALRVETMTGTTWIDPELVIYSPGECNLRAIVDTDRIFSDRFEQ